MFISIHDDHDENLYTPLEARNNFAGDGFEMTRIGHPDDYAGEVRSTRHSRRADLRNSTRPCSMCTVTATTPAI